MVEGLGFQKCNLYQFLHFLKHLFLEFRVSKCVQQREMKKTSKKVNKVCKNDIFQKKCPDKLCKTLAEKKTFFCWKILFLWFGFNRFLSWTIRWQRVDYVCLSPLSAFPSVCTPSARDSRYQKGKNRRFGRHRLILLHNTPGTTLTGLDWWNNQLNNEK